MTAAALPLRDAAIAKRENRWTDGPWPASRRASERARAAVFQHFPCIMLSTSSLQIVRQVLHDHAALRHFTSFPIMWMLFDSKLSLSAYVESVGDKFG